jgi:hypothetical protein
MTNSPRPKISPFLVSIKAVMALFALAKNFPISGKYQSSDGLSRLNSQQQHDNYKQDVVFRVNIPWKRKNPNFRQR